MVTKGYAASEVHEAFLRALELCEERGETHRRAPVLLGLWRFYNTRAEFQKAYDLGEELLILAMNIQNPAFHLEAYYAASITAPATLHPFSLPPTRRGGLRGAGGISTEARIAVNIDRGFCPKNRSAAVVPSVRVRKKLCTAVRQARFLGRASPRS